MIYSPLDCRSFFTAYKAANAFNNEPLGLYAPVDYIMNLGGKQMRPILLLMSCNLFNSEIKEALAQAYAIEIFHNFSLVHDDIMDEASLRRGKETIHKRWDLNTAILSGDVMLINAYQYLAQIRAELLPNALKIFSKAAVEVCEGQQYDVDFEESASVEIKDYLKMIELKTAALLDAAMQLGALVGGANADSIKNIGQFARNIGIAFQLQDDILDTFGDPEKFGKRIGGDIIQNKKTYLVLQALELGDASDQAYIQKTMNSKTDDEEAKIKAVTALFNRLNVRKKAEERKEEYLALAFEHLDAVDCPAERKAYLSAFAKDLMGRET